MPLETSAFPEELQLAFFIYGFLSDDWDGMSGNYMGKKWIEVDSLFEIYDIQDRRETMFWMKLWDSKVIQKRFQDSERKRKADERKSGAGKNYTHNVRG
tara:strand:- start:587 stop:883 length:297 start_codon:yes stop_codon:yes gene_type:complete